MEPRSPNAPYGFKLFPNLRPPHKTLNFHRGLVLLITFIAYASFHASRKPPSIVKSVIGPNDKSNSSFIDSGWAPFNGSDGTQKLGQLDVAFLSAYAMGMFFAGHIGDRIDLRIFLVTGMLGSGFLTIIFGLGYWLNIHVLAFFLTVQIVCGLFQSIGWPCVVSVVGNWCGKSKRGFIMGIWNSHTSIGNIFGSVIASMVLEFGWGWSFVLPGLFVIVIGILVLLFLVVTPEDIGLEPPGRDTRMNVEGSGEKVEFIEMNVEGVGEKVEFIEMNVEGSGEKLEYTEVNVDGSCEIVESEETELLNTGEPVPVVAIGFIEAWKLPGVAPFAACLFFSKFVAYIFLYWLPFYLRKTAIGGVHPSHKVAGFLSIVFDVGGVVGGVLAGYISDIIEARAFTSMIFLLLSIPFLILYRVYGSISMLATISLMCLSGLFVNGPYALITTAVAADLGTQNSIQGNSRALATVTAIIDGTGSVGAALGPLLAGYISNMGWNYVFCMLIGSIIFAGGCLSRLTQTEVKTKIDEGKWPWSWNRVES